MNTFYEVEADIDDNREYITNPQKIFLQSIEWPHFHEGIEILYFMKGEGTVVLNENKINVKSGDFVVVNSKQIHYFKTENFLEYRYIILKKEFLKKYGFPYKEKSIESKFKDTQLSEYFSFFECEENNEWFSKKATAFLILIAVNLYSLHQKEEKEIIKNIIKSKTKIVMGIMDYINENLESNISLETVSFNMGYSKYYICKIFKELTGKTVTEYINSLKCLKASQDLKNGDYTVYEVATKYGYENFSYFSKTFKKYMGTSPSLVK